MLEPAPLSNSPFFSLISRISSYNHYICRLISYRDTYCALDRPMESLRARSKTGSQWGIPNGPLKEKAKGALREKVDNYLKSLCQEEKHLAQKIESCKQDSKSLPDLLKGVIGALNASSRQDLDTLSSTAILWMDHIIQSSDQRVREDFSHYPRRFLEIGQLLKFLYCPLDWEDLELDDDLMRNAEISKFLEIRLEIEKKAAFWSEKMALRHRHNRNIWFAIGLFSLSGSISLGVSLSDLKLGEAGTIALMVAIFLLSCFSMVGVSRAYSSYDKSESVMSGYEVLKRRVENEADSYDNEFFKGRDPRTVFLEQTPTKSVFKRAIFRDEQKIELDHYIFTHQLTNDYCFNRGVARILAAFVCPTTQQGGYLLSEMEQWCQETSPGNRA